MSAHLSKTIKNKTEPQRHCKYHEMCQSTFWVYQCLVLRERSGISLRIKSVQYYIHNIKTLNNDEEKQIIRIRVDIQHLNKQEYCKN
ncbi:CLUMA_CG001743, isoform A [Clunio marinus]|uniref:CLUMA_CG001743, isoform A n=1 Tax=Clunio marinus TaxID=568069 RepID=A0A1J1HIW9_9DIPT|nr:CLUMA_CG001743, isoform A [Clunio marinus]